MTFLLLVSGMLPESDIHLVMSNVENVTFNNVNSALKYAFRYKLSGQNGVSSVTHSFHFEHAFCAEKW